MKRFLSLLLSALMLLTCLPASAEPITYKELGFSLDFSDIEANSTKYPFLMNYSIVNQEPYVSLMLVAYYNMPKDELMTIQSKLDSTKDEKEYASLNETLVSKLGIISLIVVTNAKTLDEIIREGFLPEGFEVTEFGTVGDYHYYYCAQTEDDLLSVYDEADLADVRMVQSEVLKKLQAAELFEPENSAEAFVGEVIRFESVDLDGNTLKSADLFSGNKVTMVNLWGTWCINCMNEMGELAEIHKRLMEKGCGIVGVEWEKKPMEEVADTARQALAEYGITYPNVIMPESDPIFDQIQSFPTTFFVDSEGKILTHPITGAAVSEYEPTIDMLLAGEAVEKAPNTGATANDSGEYRVIVYDTDGNPVNGVIVQLCDEATCTIQKTNADGVATFQVETPKVFDVHVAKVPEGYVSSDETYKTLDTFSDVNIFIEKAE